MATPQGGRTLIPPGSINSGSYLVVFDKKCKRKGLIPTPPREKPRGGSSTSPKLAVVAPPPRRKPPLLNLAALEKNVTPKFTGTENDFQRLRLEETARATSSNFISTRDKPLSWLCPKPNRRCLVSLRKQQRTHSDVLDKPPLAIISPSTHRPSPIGAPTELKHQQVERAVRANGYNQC